MPAAGRLSPWATGERRPHFFKVLMGDFKKRLVSDRDAQVHGVGALHVASCGRTQMPL